MWSHFCLSLWSKSNWSCTEMEKNPLNSVPLSFQENLLLSLASLNKQAKQMRAVTWSFRYNVACVGESFLWELHKSCIRLEQAENIFERLKVKRVAVLNEEQLYTYIVQEATCKYIENASMARNWGHCLNGRGRQGDSSVGTVLRACVRIWVHISRSYVKILAWWYTPVLLLLERQRQEYPWLTGLLLSELQVKLGTLPQK